MLDLAEELRGYVDAAPAIQLDEVTGASRHRRRPVLLVVATVAVCSLGLMAVGLRSVGRVAPVAVEVGSQLPAQCRSGVGCPMAPAEASERLGFSVRLPDRVPEGWVQVRGTLRQYDVGSEGGAADRDVLMYRPLWTPPGEDLNASGVCPRLLQIDQRRALPNEGLLSGRVDLGEGRTVGGSIRPSTCGNPGGAAGISGFVNWIDHGVWFRVVSWGIDQDQLVSIIRSLQR